MSNPFPLNDSDATAFQNDVGYDTLNALPQWGGIILWRNRAILVFQKTTGDYALTDITGGIPDSNVPGGVIPVDILIANVPRYQTSSAGVFLYSLSANFYAVAVEKAKEFSKDIADAAQPLIPGLGLTAIIVIGVLIFMYAPRPRG